MSKKDDWPDVNWRKELPRVVREDLADSISPYNDWFQTRRQWQGPSYVEEYLRQAPWVAGAHLVNGFVYHDRKELWESGDEFASFYRLTRPISADDAYTAGGAYAHALAWHDVVDDELNEVNARDLMPAHDETQEDTDMYLPSFGNTAKDLGDHVAWVQVYGHLRTVEDVLGVAPSRPEDEYGFAYNQWRGFRYHTMAKESSDNVDTDENYRNALKHMKQGQEALYEQLLPQEKRAYQQTLYAQCVKLHDDPSSGYRQLVNDSVYDPVNGRKPAYTAGQDLELQDVKIIDRTAKMAHLLMEDAVYTDATPPTE